MTDRMKPDGASQRKAFLKEEGNAYFERNKYKWSTAKSEDNQREDPILRVLDRLRPFDGPVLEIGCGACDRLHAIQREYDLECFGIDPSGAAIDAAGKQFPALHLERGTAETLPFDDCKFGVVIFGYCLYLVDPQDYFSVAREADRVLSDRGLLLINDFCTPTAYANIYIHQPSILARKMDWSRMFTWNPSYSLIHRELVSSKGIQDPDERVTVDVLVKDISRQFPRRG